MWDVTQFDAITISLASPEDILKWGNGEVKKPETINYRTHKPERDGLFCEKIFGPVKDWECHCGKYRSPRYKGVICEKCRVEITLSKVRRERMGNIQLATPVAHIWFAKGTPSYIALLLDISPRDLEKVLYFNSYIVIDPRNLPLMKKQLLSEEQYKLYRNRYGNLFDARMGAEAIKVLLAEIKLDRLAADLKYQLKTKTGAKKKNIIKRLEVVKLFLNSPSKPHWMILDAVPVIPPDLRPMVQLDGGRFATSDLNDLYRRVINRNNRLKRMMKLGAPEIIIKNEKRMLQEAVNSLIDNGRKGRPVTGAGKRPLKSLTDMLKGKQGRFRQNLLGKRVDYSGRSVIVVGPHLKLDQCGLPQEMAMELFKPFIIYKLVAKGLAPNVKKAKKMIERRNEETFDVLEEVVSEHPVLLNRAPTLHRFGIQAFQPVLTSGKAIELHPLVCSAFNADFDGDQMAVHIPLLLNSHAETKVLMMSKNNLFSSSNGATLTVPSHDMLIGMYYLTRSLKSENVFEVSVKKPAEFSKILGGTSPIKCAETLISTKTGDTIIQIGMVITPEIVELLIKDNIKQISIYKQFYFSSSVEAIKYYDVNRKNINLNELIWVKIDGVFIETTIGKLIFNVILPDNMPYFNDQIEKRKMSQLIEKVYEYTNLKITIEFLDSVKEMGFHYATLSGLSMSISDLMVPEDKKIIIANSIRKADNINEKFKRGDLNREEKKQNDIDIWTNTTEEVADAMIQNYQQRDREGDFNSVYVMAISGARGNMQQIRQLAAMRGLMSNPQGDIIDFPIISNFRNGLEMTEYFISTYGARKGLVDTALRTADSGYLTRRLVDVSQEVIINMPDCKTTDGIHMHPLRQKRKPNNFNVEDEIIISLKDRIKGRYTSQNIIHPSTGDIILRKNKLITPEKAKLVDKATVVLPMTEDVIGKINAEQLINARDNSIILGPDKEITKEIFDIIINEELAEEIKVRPSIVIRSPINCNSKLGICQKCYGLDLSSNSTVSIGEAVGVIAAQSIGEPGTQLTMRTFHIGGIAISQKNTIKSKKDGSISFDSLEWTLKSEKNKQFFGDSSYEDIRDDEGLDRDTRKVVLGGFLKVVSEDGKFEKYNIPPGAVLKVSENEEITSGTVLVEFNPNQIISEISGTVRLKNVIENQGYVISSNSEIIITDKKTKNTRIYKIPQGANIKVDEDDRVVSGDILTEIISEQKAAMANFDGKVEFFDLRVKNGRVINENGLIFVLPITENKKLSAEYVLPPGVKDKKTDIDLSSYGIQLKIKSGDEVKYGEELLAIYSDIDGVVNCKDKRKISIDNQEVKEYRLEKVETLIIDKKENKFYYNVPKDGYIKLLSSKTATNKTSSSKRLILSDEKAYSIPNSIKLLPSDCKVQDGQKVNQNEQITGNINLTADFEGVVEITEQDELNNTNIKLKSVARINQKSKDSLKLKLIGKVLFEDLINTLTGEILLEAGQIINEDVLKKLIIEAPISGTVNFSNNKIVDSYENFEEINGMKIAEDLVLNGKKIGKAGEIIGEALALKIMKNKEFFPSFKIIVNEVTIKAQKIFEPAVMEISYLTGWDFSKEVTNFDKEKVVIKEGEKITASNMKNLSKKLNSFNLSDIIISRRVTLPIPDGSTLRIQSGEQIKQGIELCWPTQVEKIIIINAEKEYLIPQGAILKVENGQKVKSNTTLIEPMKPIISEISGRVNYNLAYDPELKQEIIKKIYVYSGIEIKIPLKIPLEPSLQKLLKNATKPVMITKGTDLTERLEFDEIKAEDDFHYIYRTEIVNKKYTITSNIDILVNDGDIVKKGQKLCRLVNDDYFIKENIKFPKEDDYFVYNTGYFPINPTHFMIRKNNTSIILSQEIDLEVDPTIAKIISKLKISETLVDTKTKKEIIKAKEIITPKISKYIEANAENIKPKQFRVINPDISVIYTTGEIIFRNKPKTGKWSVEYASEVPGVAKLKKKETLKSISRTTLGKIEIVAGEAHQVADGAELRVDFTNIPITDPTLIRNKVINHVVSDTLFNKHTGELIIEAGNIVSASAGRVLYRERNKLNKRSVQVSSFVKKGDMLAKWGTSSKKTIDIIQGLPRVEEVFEARKPKKEAFIVELDGRAEFKGNTLLIRNPSGETRAYKTSMGTSKLLISDGEFIVAGEPINEGNIWPQSLLSTAGIRDVERYLLNEVQQVYRAQGVKINDKHIEVIIRQMLRKIIISVSGDTDFLPGQLVHIDTFEAINKKIKKEKKEQTMGKRILQGITKASLTTDSFISAASFQETTRVLTRAAIEGKKDELRGLKENLILGKLIPAGTGLKMYRNIKVRPAHYTEEEEALEDIKPVIDEIIDVKSKKNTKEQVFKDLDSLFNNPAPTEENV